jgi:chitin synthase
MSNIREAISSGELTDLVVSSSSSTTVYPSDDNILSVLQARFRADLPYTRIGASGLVVVNPLKVLANVNDASAQEYEERNYKDTSLPTADAPKALQPHLYDLAARVYLLMLRRNESQSIIFRCVISHYCVHTILLCLTMFQRYHRIRKNRKRPVTC